MHVISGKQTSKKMNMHPGVYISAVFFGGRVSLHGPGYPETGYVEQASLNREPPGSASWALG